jgi:hypothetical protein
MVSETSGYRTEVRRLRPLGLAQTANKLEGQEATPPRNAPTQTATFGGGAARYPQVHYSVGERSWTSERKGAGESMKDRGTRKWKRLQGILSSRNGISV